LFACSLCSLLDETLVAFAVMFTRDVLGGGEIAQSTMVAMFSSGAAVGVALMPRALARLKPLALLAWTSVACTVAYSAWLFSTALVPATVLIFAAGMTVGPLYPLAKAQAFRALPERSGLVNALNAAFTPLDIVLPYGIGYVADTYGIRWALAILVLQPIGLGLIALIEVRRARRSSGSAAA
jgi:fucose permease